MATATGMMKSCFGSVGQAPASWSDHGWKKQQTLHSWRMSSSALTRAHSSTSPRSLCLCGMVTAHGMSRAGYRQVGRQAVCQLLVQGDAVVMCQLEGPAWKPSSARLGKEKVVPAEPAADVLKDSRTWPLPTPHTSAVGKPASLLQSYARPCLRPSHLWLGDVESHQAGCSSGLQV